MKKIITLCLALLLILSAMSACTENAAPANSASAEAKASIEPSKVPATAGPSSVPSSEAPYASQSKNESPIQRVYGKDDTNIAVSAGQTFSIQLDENPTTGYEWSDAVIDNKNMVQQTSTNYEATPAASGIVGSGGARIITFKALTAGKATITLNYQRSWEKKPTETIVFNVSVN